MEGGAFTVDSTEAGVVAVFRTGSITSAEVRVTRLNSVRHWLVISGQVSKTSASFTSVPGATNRRNLLAFRAVRRSSEHLAVVSCHVQNLGRELTNAQNVSSLIDILKFGSVTKLLKICFVSISSQKRDPGLWSPNLSCTMYSV